MYKTKTQYRVSDERKKQYEEIREKHFKAFLDELRENNFCPIPLYIGCDVLCEAEEIKKLHQFT